MRHTSKVELGDSLNVLENSLRDLVEIVLRKAHGDDWFEHLGVSQDRIDQWKSRRDEEPKRRPGGEVEERLLYYSDFNDVVKIIQKNWDGGFKDCFGDRRRFDVYADRLSAFRNPDAHSRALLPFEENLLLGMVGELRQVTTLFLSSGAGGPEPEYFPRIEEVRDSYGSRATGHASEGKRVSRNPVTLRPGDTVSFVGRAWDPEGAPIRWEIYLVVQQKNFELSGTEIEWEWEVREEDISEESSVLFTIHSPRPYHRQRQSDDVTSFKYRVLPSR